MNICILAPRYPFPEVGGDVLRINYIARYLKGQGHHLTLVAFKDYEEEMPDVEGLYDHIYTFHRHKFASYWGAFISLLKGESLQRGYYRSRSFGKFFKNIINKHHFDLYISHLLRLASYLEENSLQEKSIIEMTDALSKTYAQSFCSKGTKWLRLVYSIEAKRIKEYEQHIIQSFPKVVLVSQKDVDYLIKGRDIKHVVMHTNGVEICDTTSQKHNADHICFIGNLRTLQNTDAILYFAKEVFPLILKKRPNAKFYIIGANALPEIKALTCENIILTGFIENLSDAFRDQCVAVAPVRVAAGIQNKVLVAMAHRCPVVLSSLIAPAIPELDDGVNCMIRDSAQDIANACLDLMNNSEKRNHLAQNGYDMVRTHYSWGKQLEGYEDLRI